MAAPTWEPPLSVRSGSSGGVDYQSGQPVWIYRTGSWHPGVVLSSSPKAVLVRYRPSDGPGTAVDTVTSESLEARPDRDPVFDAAIGPNATR